MSKPHPTHVFHFTRVEHLSQIIKRGLLSDNQAKAQAVLAVEIGNADIKQRRQRKDVDIHPGGTVADYVPFYFAPRSPMMYVIDKGNVPTYTEGCDRLIYLVSTVEQFMDNRLELVVSDRNAAMNVAEFEHFSENLPEDFIDWPLMKERMWQDVPEYQDRKERRMAECLVHGSVPWSNILHLAAKSEEVAQEARTILLASDANRDIDVRPNWYF